MSNKDEDTMLVSVCVQTYQHVSFIKECLDGILMQKTNFSFEVVVGEDDSTDGTREICIEYSEKYPDKIRLFLRSREDVIYIQGSPTGRFNFLENLKAARGKYIALCEGDDFWIDPLKLQKQVDFLEANPEFSFCFHRVYELNDSQRYLSSLNLSEKEEEYSINDLAKGNFIHTPSVLFKNPFIHNNELPSCLHQSPIGDYVIHLLNARNGKIKYFPQPMAVYRLHTGGVWSSIANEVRLEKAVTVLSLLIAEFRTTPVVSELLIKQLASIVWLLIKANESPQSVFNKLEKLSAEEFKILASEVLTKALLERTGLEQSYSYRVGNLLLKPISYLKQLANNRKR